MFLEKKEFEKNFNNFEILNKKIIFKNKSEFNNYFENINKEKNTLNEMDR